MAKKKAASEVDTSDMERAGFVYEAEPESSNPMRVEAISVEGFENGGKTSFGLSASELGPVAYIPMDSGHRAADWFRAQGRSIGKHKLMALLPDAVDPQDFLAVSEAMEPKLRELRAACRAAIDAKVFACVIDTGSDVEDLVGYALNGRISLDVYGGEGRLKKAVSSTMSSFYRMFEASDTNLIVTHKLSEFKDQIYPQAWKGTNYACPHIVRAEFDHEIEGDLDSPKKFYTRIIKAKYRPEIQGQRFKWNRLTGYRKIAAMLLPEAASEGAE